jgi:hypothetical protein
MTPLSLLTQNAAGMSSSSVSNGPDGGELRQQALERQQNSATLQTNRVSEAYNHLESILETVVWRILAGPLKPGCDGYHEIKWIRERLENYKIPYEKLASRKHGRFQYLRVRARRTAGNGDRVQQLATADWLMANLQNYDPTVRPRIIHQATMLHTQDPDAADAYTKIPKAIVNAQKLVAENEADVIAERAPLGQMIPLNPDDIHQDHIPIHLVSMQARIARHGVRPWDKLDVIVFAGLTEHTTAHLKILLENPVTNAEGKAFIQDFQNIAQAAQAIVAEVEEKQGSEQSQLTPVEQANFELKWAQEHRKGMELGIKLEDNKRLAEVSFARSALMHRQSYVKEINEDRRLKLDAERVKNQAEAQKNKKKSEQSK